MTREVVITDQSACNVTPQNPIRTCCILAESVIWCWSFTLFFIAMQTHMCEGNMVRMFLKTKTFPWVWTQMNGDGSLWGQAVSAGAFSQWDWLYCEDGQEGSWSLSSQGATTNDLVWQHKIVSRILDCLQDCGQIMCTGTNLAERKTERKQSEGLRSVWSKYCLLSVGRDRGDISRMTTGQLRDKWALG